MAKLTSKDVVHVAKLAKLDLTPSEISKFQKQLSSVVDYVSELGEVDVENTDPTSQTTGLTDVVRDDEIDTTNCLSNEDALSGTDNTHNGYFVVPRILEK